MSETLRGLTIQQPWASAVAAGAKMIENRTWGTKHRGPLVIHAGKTRPAHLALTDDRIAALWPDAVDRRWPKGVLLCVAELVDCHADQGCCRPWGEGSFVNRTTGALERTVYHWVLEDVRPVQRVALKGSLGLLRISADLVRRLS